MNPKVFIRVALVSVPFQQVQWLDPDVIWAPLTCLLSYQLTHLLETEPGINTAKFSTMGTFVLSGLYVKTWSCTPFVMICSWLTTVILIALPIGLYCSPWRLVHRLVAKITLVSHYHRRSVSRCVRAKSSGELSLSFPCNDPLRFWLPCCRLDRLSIANHPPPRLPLELLTLLPFWEQRRMKSIQRRRTS